MNYKFVFFGDYNMTIKNILIVDDSAFMRAIIRKVLEKNNFVVIAEAGDGAEAVELYNKHKPDLVFMDVVMPNMDGVTAVKNIVAGDSNAKVVMCSSAGQQAIVKESIDAGAIGFITKPFQEGKILDEIAGAE
jgi:two-component system, chemotaxis family, chemotaxis protein CheY